LSLVILGLQYLFRKALRTIQQQDLVIPELLIGCLA
jgi:hypothetical protein